MFFIIKYESDTYLYFSELEQHFKTSSCSCIVCVTRSEMLLWNKPFTVVDLNALLIQNNVRLKSEWLPIKSFNENSQFVNKFWRHYDDSAFLSDAVLMNTLVWSRDTDVSQMEGRHTLIWDAAHKLLLTVIKVCVETR